LGRHHIGSWCQYFSTDDFLHHLRCSYFPAGIIAICKSNSLLTKTSTQKYLTWVGYFISYLNVKQSLSHIDFGAVRLPVTLISCLAIFEKFDRLIVR
jgi:hypothetical protein